MENKPVNEISLTNKDNELILLQCQHQNATSPEQIEGFKNAYLNAKKFGYKFNGKISADEILNLILNFSETIEKQNAKGFRTTPVTFSNMNKGLDANLIPRAIDNFCVAYADFLKNPESYPEDQADYLYKEFQEIHPFEDGNGRTGDLLWKIAKKISNKQWPETLPPKMF